MEDIFKFYGVECVSKRADISWKKLACITCHWSPAILACRLRHEIFHVLHLGHQNKPVFELILGRIPNRRTKFDLFKISYPAKSFNKFCNTILCDIRDINEIQVQNSQIVAFGQSSCYYLEIFIINSFRTNHSSILFHNLQSYLTSSRRSFFKKLILYKQVATLFVSRGFSILNLD